MSFVAVAGCAVCAAAIADGRDNDKQEKVKPAAKLPAKVDTQRSPYALIDLDGAEDGRPYGLRLTGVNDREVAISWNTPEPTDGYWDDFEDHDDFVINSTGSVGWQYIDADNALTYTWQACTFPNMGTRRRLRPPPTHTRTTSPSRARRCW